MEAFKSRKLWITVLGAVGVSVVGLENAPWYVLAAVAVIIAGYSLGQGLADQGKEAAKITAAPVKVTSSDVIAIPDAAPRVIASEPEPPVDKTAPTIPATKDEP